MSTVFDPHFWTVLGMLAGSGALATVGITLLLDVLVTRWQRHHAATRDAPHPAARTRARLPRPHHHAHAQ